MHRDAHVQVLLEHRNAVKIILKTQEHVKKHVETMILAQIKRNTQNDYWCLRSL